MCWKPDLDIYAGATWNLGAHELKFGLDYSNNEVYNAFLQDTNGKYTFAASPAPTASAPSPAATT
jgi:outer membrane receptor protein involved in Fe transport